jgi:PAS domain S-box-containing protein
MQNEELRRTHLELHAARDKYSDLYDFAPVGYFTISEKGMISDVNLTMCTMLGVERGLLAGNPFSHFINRDDQDIFYYHRKKTY